MPIDYDRLIRFPIPPVTGRYTERDTMLYALAVGMGANPIDDRELAFVFEKDLRVLPTMATVLVWNDAWMYDTGPGRYAAHSGARHPSGLMAGKRMTSRIEGRSAITMSSRSIPTPTPPAGGIPYSSARM